jgi:hypothetical protein
MRCPKCGYISFDNLDSCLKCSKNISDATRAFQGSTLKVNTPSFLKISVPDEDELQIEGAAEVGGEIEITSAPGEGTTVRIQVEIQMAMADS